MNGNLALKGITEYNTVEKAIERIGGAPYDLERLLEELQGIDGLQTQNYDGTYFEIEQERTILTVDFLGIMPQIELDTSKNKCGDWIETDICVLFEELREEYRKITGLDNDSEMTDDQVFEYMEKVFKD